MGRSSKDLLKWNELYYASWMTSEEYHASCDDDDVVVDAAAFGAVVVDSSPLRLAGPPSVQSALSRVKDDDFRLPVFSGTALNHSLT